MRRYIVGGEGLGEEGGGGEGEGALPDPIVFLSGERERGRRRETPSASWLLRRAVHARWVTRIRVLADTYGYTHTHVYSRSLSLVRARARALSLSLARSVARSLARSISK